MEVFSVFIKTPRESQTVNDHLIPLSGLGDLREILLHFLLLPSQPAHTTTGIHPGQTLTPLPSPARRSQLSGAPETSPVLPQLLLHLSKTLSR